MLLVAEYERTGSYSATAQHFGVHENTVKRWVERFTLTGDVLTASRERVSTVVTPAFLDVALKLVDEGYRDLVYGVESWSDLLREIRSQGFTCSRRTLVDTLKKQGVVLRTLRRRPSLTLEHKEKRLQFCKAMLEKSDAQLLHFVYCDEKKFTCGRGRSGRTYLCRRTDPHKEQRGELESWYGGNGIMVWMGVSLKHGFHLHIFPPRNSEGQKLTVTGEIFDQAMKKPRGFLQYLKRHPAATIAMDNCPAHNKARSIYTIYIYYIYYIYTTRLVVGRAVVHGNRGRWMYILYLYRGFFISDERQKRLQGRTISVQLEEQFVLRHHTRGFWRIHYA